MKAKHKINKKVKYSLKHFLYIFKQLKYNHIKQNILRCQKAKLVLFSN